MKETEVRRSSALDKFIATGASNLHGYRKSTLGKYERSQDAYCVTIRWPAKGGIRSHRISANAFLRACMRDVTWNFFHGQVNFTQVIGIRKNHGKVDRHAGTFNGVLKAAGGTISSNSRLRMSWRASGAILLDRVNEGIDPFAALVF